MGEGQWSQFIWDGLSKVGTRTFCFGEGVCGASGYMSCFVFPGKIDLSFKRLYFQFSFDLVFRGRGADESIRQEILS